MKYQYLVVDCEMGTVRGTDDRNLAEWYSNGDYSLVIDLNSEVVLMGNDELTLFEEDPIKPCYPKDEDEE